MEELMKTKIFKVTVERLLLNGGQTLYMVGWSLLVGTIIGMILALILVLCRKGGLAENRPLYWIVSAYINVVRSIPFVILLVTIMPITRAIVGTTIGSTAALVPLVVYISPYLARLMENSLLEINPGIWRRLRPWARQPGRSSAISWFRKPWVPWCLHLQQEPSDFSERPRWLVMSAEAESVTWR